MENYKKMDKTASVADGLRLFPLLDLCGASGIACVSSQITLSRGGGSFIYDWPGILFALLF